MKRIVTKILLSGLIVSSIASSLQAMSWRQWFANAPSSVATSLYNASTQTKILVGLGALATAGLGYYVYRIYNPTDEEIIAAAQLNRVKLYDIKSFFAAQITDPVTEEQLQYIGDRLTYEGFDPSHIESRIHQSISTLLKDKAVLSKHIAYNERKQYATAALKSCLADVTESLAILAWYQEIVQVHQQFFRLHRVYHNTLQEFSESLAVKENIKKLMLIIERKKNLGDFKLMRFADDIITRSEQLAKELAYNPFYGDYQYMYNKKREMVTRIAADLKILGDTILGSQEYKDDRARKDAYDADQRRLELERQRIAQEQQRIAQERERIRIEAQKAADERAARLEKLRIEQARLELEREKAQREREKAQHEQYNNYA